VTRFALLRALEKTGVRHAFLEDCPCGGCADFFAFGRGRDGSLWIAFSTDGEPFRLWREEHRMSLKNVSRELRRVVAIMHDVLAVSDPPEGVGPIDLSPPPPSAEVAERIRARLRRPRRGVDEPRKITFRGETHTIPEWAVRVGIGANALHYRFSAGWSAEDALTTPLKKWRAA
jgi:hypothetical protein